MDRAVLLPDVHTHTLRHTGTHTRHIYTDTDTHIEIHTQTYTQHYSEMT